MGECKYSSTIINLELDESELSASRPCRFTPEEVASILRTLIYSVADMWSRRYRVLTMVYNT
jgi:hypothetical protein